MCDRIPASFIFALALSFAACGSSFSKNRVAIGAAHIERGHYELAGSELRAELVEHPKNVAAHYEMARLEALKGHGPEAERQLDMVLKASPNNPSAHANMGWVQVAGDGFKGAKKHFEHALAMDEEESSARAGLGVLALRKGDEADAKAQFERALQRNPQNEVAHNFLEAIRTGRAEQALGPDLLPDVARALFRSYSQTTKDVVKEERNRESQNVP